MSVVCASCGATVLPALGACFDCELVSAPSPARSLRRYRVHGAAHQQRLTTIMSALSPTTSADEVAWFVSQREFDIVAELTDPQERMLLDLLRSVGAPASASFAGGPHGIRLNRDRGLLVKGGVALGFGVAAVAFSVPLVPFASVAMLGYLGVRGFRLVRRELTLPRPRVDQMLGPLDQRLLSEARVARAGIQTNDVLDVTRDALACACEILTTLRTEAAHLTTAEIQRADVEVTELGCDILRLCAKTDVLSRPASDGYRTMADRTSDAMKLLRDIHGKLTELRDAARLLRPGEAPGTALAELTRAAVRLRASSREALSALHGVGPPTPPSLRTVSAAT